MPDLRLDLMEETNTAIAWQMSEDGGVDLLDVVGARIPSLADILASLHTAPARVTVHFAPDHLDWAGAGLPDENDMVLMLRGSGGLSPEQPFALPPMAEF
jgi:hypothetical protein